jgi:hypothetical protein
MSKKHSKTILLVNDYNISVIKVEDQDYISLTDILKSKDGDFYVSDWLRNRNTLEFLAAWERLHNQAFNEHGFTSLLVNSGLNSFKISVKQWTDRTGSKGVIAKEGKYGGTFAHIDIALEFCTWISPEFKLYLIKEYQRLKKQEVVSQEWDVRRLVSKANYHIQTDAVKNHIIPHSKKWNKEMAYAEEADILNIALFGVSAKEWRDSNPKAPKNHNIRDYANINQLIVLSNLESANAAMIRDGIPKKERFEKLRNTVRIELPILDSKDPHKSLSQGSQMRLLNHDKKKK